MGLSRVCEDLLKNARLAFVKQDWSKAVDELSVVLNEVRDTDSEVDLAMAPVHILYAFCLLRQISNRENNPDEKLESVTNPVASADSEEAAGPSSSDQPGPSSSSSSAAPGPSGEEVGAEEEDDLNELEEPAKSLMLAWEVLLLAKSIFERFPAKANKLEELHAMQLQAEILFHNNDVQCLDYLDKIVEELKNFPSVIVWTLKVLLMKAAYVLAFKQDEKFAETLNIINGRLEDAMSEVDQSEGAKLQKLLAQVEAEVKELMELEKEETKTRGKKPISEAENILQLNADELRRKIETKLLAVCSCYPLSQEERGTSISARMLDDLNEIIADGMEEETKKTSTAPRQIIESEQIGFGNSSEVQNGTSSGTSSLMAVRRKAPSATTSSPEKGRRVTLTPVKANGNGTHNGSSSSHDDDEPKVKRPHFE